MAIDLNKNFTEIKPVLDIADDAQILVVSEDFVTNETASYFISGKDAKKDVQDFDPQFSRRYFKTNELMKNS